LSIIPISYSKQNIMIEKIDYVMFSLPINEVQIIRKYEENRKELVVEMKGKVIKHLLSKIYHTSRLRISRKR